MSKITEKVKSQTSEPTFWHVDESVDAHAEKINAENKIHTTIAGDKGKLYKINFVEKKEDEFDRETLPKPIGWDIADGDYVKDNSAIELPKMQTLKELKNFKLVFLIASLVITALVVLFFAAIASKA